MKHILLVEPDRVLSNTYEEILKRAGLSVAKAVSAAGAVSLCEDQIPDLIVLELQLHGHSGVELLHELRSYPEWQHIPVLLHTYVPKQKLNKFEAAFKTMGIAGYAYKPTTSLSQFVRLIEEYAAVSV